MSRIVWEKPALLQGDQPSAWLFATKSRKRRSTILQQDKILAKEVGSATKSQDPRISVLYLKASADRLGF